MQKRENLITEETGTNFGKGLGETSRYEESQQKLDEAIAQGMLAEELLNVTPPVGVNFLILLKQLQSVGNEALLNKITSILNPDIQAAFLGLAIADGITDLEKLLKNLTHEQRNSEAIPWNRLHVVDIDSVIIKKVETAFSQLIESGRIVPKLADARESGIATSLNLTIRDHTDNCCPPFVSQGLNQAAWELTKKGGLALINVTTSELLAQSTQRQIVTTADLRQLLTASNISPDKINEIFKALCNEVFDLAKLIEKFPELEELKKELRGAIIEIKPNSFVVFGEDERGHGEWFRSWEQHRILWDKTGWNMIFHHQREGNDSHQPPLRCRRHIVLLQKPNNQAISQKKKRKE